jgi:predicted Rossmann fold flavoprotein
LTIDLLPDIDAMAMLREQRTQRPTSELKTILGECLPKRFAQRLCETSVSNRPLAQYPDKEFAQIVADLKSWPIVASGTEGYRTAEVTLGGVDTDELSSTTMQSRRVPGLYFIGEVVDVTGHLGGYNFQWAWASGHAAGCVV